MTKRSELSHETIAAAINGDAHAISQVIEYFHTYIVYLSKIESFNYNGDAYYYFDSEIQSDLEAYLITKILEFEIKDKEDTAK